MRLMVMERTSLIGKKSLNLGISWMSFEKLGTKHNRIFPTTKLDQWDLKQLSNYLKKTDSNGSGNQITGIVNVEN